MKAFILFLVVFTSQTMVGAQHYHLVPVNSTDLCQQYQVGSCITLNEVSSRLSKVGKNSNIVLSFLPGNHLLTWNMSFRGMNKVTFNSEQVPNHSFSAPSIIYCLEGVGITIEDSRFFFMQGVTIRDSARVGYGLGGIISLKNTSAKIFNCVFANNSVDGHGGGGAIYIQGCQMCHYLVESCIFQLNSVRSSEYYSLRANGGAIAISGRNCTMIITNTSFINNSATGGGGAVFTDDLNLTIIGSSFINNTASKGGGICVQGSAAGLLVSASNMYVHNTAANGGAVFTMVATKFESNSFHDNKAQQGAAAYVKQNTTFSNCDLRGNLNSKSLIISVLATVQFVKHNKIENNLGGLYAYYSTVSFVGNTLFRNNTSTGLSGGAISSIESTITFEQSSQTVISNNNAKKGGGCNLEQSTINVYGVIDIAENVAESMGGGIYAIQTKFKVTNSESKFRNIIQLIRIKHNIAKNDGGGLYLTESSINLSDKTITLVGNTAKHYGGGMFLDSTSGFTISGEFRMDNPYITLKSNSATKGGGIFVKDQSDEALCNKEKKGGCFLQTVVWKSIEFYPTMPPITVYEDNTATEAGKDIYGGLLDRCNIKFINTPITLSKYYNGLQFIQSNAAFKWAPYKTYNQTYGQARNISELQSHISSDPVRVCFCEDNEINCNFTHPTVFKKKGESLAVHLSATDQVGMPINATLISSLCSTKGNVGRLKEGQQRREIRVCTELEYNVYSSDDSAVIELYTDGPCQNQGISKQKLSIIFLPCTCPIGLTRVPPDIDCTCDCDERLSPYINNCVQENGTAQVNTNTWIKYVNSTNSTDYITHVCPFDYCVAKPVIITIKNQDEHCAFNRTGTLCGKCKDGLSLVFGTSRCYQCSNYYLLLLFPFALAGIALVAFVLILNTTVATGAIHGLVFYANMLAANRSIFLPSGTPTFLSVFISWVNLDLGIETCFYNQMDSYGKLLLQLVFPGYVFLLIAIIMVLCDRSHRFAGLLGKRNPEATLYTLILLSYSKLIRLIISALQFTIIRHPEDSQEIIWLYDANVLYFTASHIPRFIAAIIITLLGTVYTALLLFGQLFNRYSKYKVMQWTTHKYYIHFLKAHHAPFSDKHRYWVGLLLLVRLVQCLISAFAEDSVIILSATLISFSLLFYKQLTHEKIYRTKWLDWLDSLFLVNLSFLGVSTLFLNSRGTTMSQKMIATVSMSISFILFLALVLNHCIAICRNKHRKKITLISQHPHMENKERDKEDCSEKGALIELKDIDNNAPTEIISVTDPTRYITPPIIRSALCDNMLREPALDDLIPVTPADYIENGKAQASQNQVARMPTFTEIDIKEL